MSRRFQPRSTPAENFRIILRSMPWKFLLILPILFVLAIPTYFYGMGMGGNIVPALSNVFYNFAAPPPPPTPTPVPAFPANLPMSGSILYTVKEGDNCVSILAFEMRMSNAGQIFSDVKPETVKALNNTVGKDCHKIQPGMTLTLSPHYPVTALGGIVRKIDATSPQEVLPTPLIEVPNQEPDTVDCSRGCLLTVQIAPEVNIRLHVETTLSIRIGSWVWSQAMLARQPIKGFDTYPYVDPEASLDGTTLRACDLQVDHTPDENGLVCSQIQPNTIRDDGGTWLLGVTGPGGLDHWRYNIRQPPNTRVMLWLSNTSKGLQFQPGNPLYRYDDASGLYVKV